MKTKKLNGLTIYLTNDCNLRCKHCWVSGGTKKQYLKRDYILERIDEAVSLGIKDFLLTGGEPFLHGDISSIIEHILNHDGVGLSIETNSLCINNEHIRILTKYSSRVNVAVSIDGSTAEIHDNIRGLRGAFEKTIDKIRILATIGCLDQCIMAISKTNYFDIENTIELCVELGAKALRILPVQPCGRGRDMDSQESLISLTERIELFKKIQNLKEKYNSKISVNMPIPPAFLPLYQVRNYKNECSFCHRLTILANGRYSLCGIGEADEDFQFGKSYETCIYDCWTKNNKIKQIFESVETKLIKPCSMCIFRHICKGFCMANAFKFPFKDGFGYNFCVEAYKKGMFPVKYIERGEKND